MAHTDLDNNKFGDFEYPHEIALDIFLGVRDCNGELIDMFDSLPPSQPTLVLPESEIPY